MKKAALLAPFLALLSLSIIPMARADQARPAGVPASSISPAVGSDNAGAITDDDGPDDGELTYTWQNAKYSRDERRQMGYILMFLSGAAIFSVLRPPKSRADRHEMGIHRS